MNPKAANMLIIAITIVLIGAIGLFFYQANSNRQNVQSQQQPAQNIPEQKSTDVAPNTTPQVSTMPAPGATTTAVKTYTNTKNGFEFQYPKEWEVYETIAAENTYSKSGFVVYVGPKANIDAHRKPNEGTDSAPPYFKVAIQVPKKAAAVDENCQYANDSGLKFAPFTIGGVKTNQCISPGM